MLTIGENRQFSSKIAVILLESLPWSRLIFSLTSFKYRKLQPDGCSPERL